MGVVEALQGGMRAWADGLRNPVRRAIRRITIAVLCVGLIAFFLSSGLSHKTMGLAVSVACTFTTVLAGLAAPLKEISPVLKRWCNLAAGAAAGAALGLAAHLISR
jgi:hypothetical protein